MMGRPDWPGGLGNDIQMLKSALGRKLGRRAGGRKGRWWMLKPNRGTPQPDAEPRNQRWNKTGGWSVSLFWVQFEIDLHFVVSALAQASRQWINPGYPLRYRCDRFVHHDIS